VNGGRSISKYRKNETVFSQSSSADAVFYIQKGKVKVTVVSEQGKEAVVAVLGPDEFCGEIARRHRSQGGKGRRRKNTMQQSCRMRFEVDQIEVRTA
jgi:CRP-like cAMP-binding protein